MTQAHLDTDGDAGRLRIVSGSSSSGGEEDWHSTPASPTLQPLKPVNGTNEAAARPAATGVAVDTAPSQQTPVAKAMPPTAAFTERGAASSPRPGSNNQREQGLSTEQGSSSTRRLGPEDPPASIPPSSGVSAGATSNDDAFSDVALDEQRQSGAPSVAASEASEAARVFATPPLPSTPTMPPLPERPRAAHMSTASILADEDGPVPTLATARHSMPPPLPSRNSIGSAAAFQQLPQKRRSQRVRPASLATVMGNGGSLHGSGTASPSSSTASPRSSFFFSPSYLARALPQTPTSVVSGGSRPPSYGGYYSSPSYGSNTRTRPLSLRMDVPRPLRLQPSPLIRSGTGALTPGGSSSNSNNNGRAGNASSGGEVDYDMAWLRAHQSAARMARRRQREQHLAPEEHKRYLQLLESRDGTFEVLACFLQRLARAENEALEPVNFPTSFAEQRRQKENMESMRQETVEALTPLLAYGPSDPTPPPPPSAFAPASYAATPKRSASSASTMASKMGPVPGHSSSIGLPPTPPLSPHRRDVRRESGMSSITETSLGGGNASGGDYHHSHLDEGISSSSSSSSIFGAAGSRTSTDTWRSSMKRASALFSGWGSSSSSSNNNNNNNNNNSASAAAPASTTRFSGD